jgi:hypothetical protein
MAGPVDDTHDDRGEYLSELTSHDERTLGVGLRWSDLQQREDLSRARQAVLHHAVVVKLEQLLDTHACRTQHLDDRKGPKGAVLLEHELTVIPAGGIDGPERPGVGRRTPPRTKLVPAALKAAPGKASRAAPRRATAAWRSAR